MSLIRTAILLLLVACVPSCSTQHKPAAPKGTRLSRELDTLLHQRDDGSVRYAARVIDLRTGRELYAHDIDVPVMPASNGKLAVTAATLDHFGASHTFPTYLALDGNDLWLIGSGDPGTGDNPIAKKTGGTTMTILDRFADALQAHHVTRIAGNLYFYDGAFEDQRIAPSWSKSYLTDWYAAPIAGLNFNNNCIDVHVDPTTVGQPAAVKIIPPTSIVKFENKCVTAVPDATTQPVLRREPEADVFTLSGSTTKPTDLKPKPITDPGLFFADALRTHLAARGITIAGQTQRAPKPLGGSIVPPPDKVVAVYETRMTDALARINKNSQNNFAEAFDKMLGRAYRLRQGRLEPGSWKAGEEAVKAFLARNNISTKGVVIADGSGLSRDNRVTSRMITDLLVVMWRHPSAKAYFNSLCVAGYDGTLSKRMTDLHGNVFAKTGYIGGVRSLSGYIHTNSDEWLAFSIIYNGIKGGVDPFEKLQDNACRVLVDWPNVRPLPAVEPTTEPATMPTSEPSESPAEASKEPTTEPAPEPSAPAPASAPVPPPPPPPPPPTPSPAAPAAPPAPAAPAAPAPPAPKTAPELPPALQDIPAPATSR